MSSCRETRFWRVFSAGTMIVMAGVIAINQRNCWFCLQENTFPRLMNLISKTERIDGRVAVGSCFSGLDDWILGLHASDRLAGVEYQSDMG